jgi:two-component system sensor histidine kinase DevS
MDRAELAGALIDSSPDGLLLVDTNGIIHVANPVAGWLFGYDQAALIGTSVDALVPNEYRHTHPLHRASYLETPSSRPMGTGLQLFGEHSSGEMFPVEVSLSPCTIEGVVYTIATIRDVSERQESAAQMAMLHDRQRIARDLHDMVIQRLFAAGMSLQAVQETARPAIVADRIATTISELDDTIRELRSAIFRLGQHGEQRTLSAQITELIHERSRHLGFEPDLRLVGDIDALPDFIADQLVATVTEGLSNVVRHANASAATVRIERVADGLLLLISDNGIGLSSEPKRSGGLSNMMWRAAELGGTCTVGLNQPAPGTRLVWHVPA